VPPFPVKKKGGGGFLVQKNSYFPCLMIGKRGKRKGMSRSSRGKRGSSPEGGGISSEHLVAKGWGREKRGGKPKSCRSCRRVDHGEKKKEAFMRSEGGKEKRRKREGEEGSSPPEKRQSTPSVVKPCGGCSKKAGKREGEGEGKRGSPLSWARRKLPSSK